MSLYVYDVEVAPNFFSAVVIPYKGEDSKVFEISERRNDSQQIQEFLDSKPILIGYNNHSYDDPIIVAAGSGYTNKKIFNLSKNLITMEEGKEKWDLIRKYSLEETSIDLIRMLFSRKLRVSLKSLMVTLKWKKLQDLPFTPEEKIPTTMMDEVINYNFNDVIFTKHLAQHVGDQLNLRVGIEKEYGLNVMSRDGVSTGVSLLLRLYSNKTNKKEQEIRQLRTHREGLSLAECIVPSVWFNTKEFNALLEDYKNGTRANISQKVAFKGKVYSYGIGGLHSEDDSRILTPEDDEVFIDSDVTSYYPSLIIQYNLCPQHLGQEFVSLYEDMFQTRVTAKREGNKLVNETYKLALNGTFGNLNNHYSWLYDPKVFFTITISGQLLLSMLCEMLELAGFQVISANTDGVTSRVKKSRYADYTKVCKEWEHRTKMNLEYTLFNKIIRRDVNCYYNIVCDKQGVSTGEVKEKGSWARETKLGKGFDKPVIQKALYEYFVNDIPVENTIKHHDDIYDFCMSQKVGKQFEVEYKDKPTQRINRYYITTSKEGGSLMKVKENGQKVSLAAGQNIMLFNDYVEMDDYQIDYQYYIRTVKEIIDLVEHQQLALF
jgi:type III secretion system FlhB-like substrate exporter